MSTDLELAQPKPMAAMEMIQVAFQKALDSGGPEALAVADRILEQMAKQRDYEDRDRFNSSLLRIQKSLKPVVKKGWNDSTKSFFAKTEDVDRAIQALMQQEGMSLSFEPEENSQPNMVTIVGVLSQGAYSCRYPLPIPCDGQGAKGGGVMTKVHATGSAITYGKRYLKNMIFDLQFKQKDDDGNGAAGISPEEAGDGLETGEAADLLSLIEGSGDQTELQTNYFKARDAATKAKDMRAIEAFANAKNKRLGQLNRAKAAQK